MAINPRPYVRGLSIGLDMTVPTPPIRLPTPLPVPLPLLPFPADQDIAGRYAPVLFGVTNALSSLMGSASVYATGALLDGGYSWATVFQLVAATYLVGTTAFVLMASGERQFD